MTWSAQEKHDTNDALETRKLVIFQQTDNQAAGNVNRYVLCRMQPIQVMTPAEVTAYAAIFSVTIASA